MKNMNAAVKALMSLDGVFVLLKYRNDIFDDDGYYRELRGKFTFFEENGRAGWHVGPYRIAMEVGQMCCNVVGEELHISSGPSKWILKKI